MVDLIPAPARCSRNSAGCTSLDGDTALEAGPGTEGVARWLRANVGAATGLPFPERGEGGNRVVLGIAADLPPEGYRVVNDGGPYRIEGGDAAGVFWGAQTFRQLLGPDAFRRAPLRP